MSDGTKDAAWQKQLLPLMISMLVVLTLFFCVGLCLEAYRIQKHVEDAHDVDVRPLFASVGANQAKSFENQMELAEWQTMALLENNALQSRYHEATVALLIRICIVFLGFLTGMVLALIGATFILGKLREAPTNLSAESAAWKVMLGTASPGLVLAVLGAVLMLATISARIDVNVTDAALYLSSANAQRAATIRTETAPAAGTTTPEKPEKRSTLLNELPDSKH